MISRIFTISVLVVGTLAFLRYGADYFSEGGSLGTVDTQLTVDGTPSVTTSTQRNQLASEGARDFGVEKSNLDSAGIGRVVLDELSLKRQDNEFRQLIQQANESLPDVEAREIYSKEILERSAEYKKQVLAFVKSKMSETTQDN